MCKVNKRICSGLLSLSLALGVFTRKSDANFTGGTLRTIGGTVFWGTAAICNIYPAFKTFSAKGGEAKGMWAMGWLVSNAFGLFGYVPGALVYTLGCLCDLGDNRHDDMEEKRRQAEEKRKQEEHEMQMALLKKKLEEK